MVELDDEEECRSALAIIPNSRFGGSFSRANHAPGCHYYPSPSISLYWNSHKNGNKSISRISVCKGSIINILDIVLYWFSD